SSPSLLSRPPPPPRSTLFPYTTLFRSHRSLGNIDIPADFLEAFSQYIAAIFIAGGNFSHTVLRALECRNGCHLNGREGTIIVVADRKSTRLNSSHVSISYAVFCLQKQK